MTQTFCSNYPISLLTNYSCTIILYCIVKLYTCTIVLYTESVHTATHNSSTKQAPQHPVVQKTGCPPRPQPPLWSPYEHQLEPYPVLGHQHSCPTSDFIKQLVTHSDIYLLSLVQLCIRVRLRLGTSHLQKVSQPHTPSRICHYLIVLLWKVNMDHLGTVLRFFVSLPWSQVSKGNAIFQSRTLRLCHVWPPALPALHTGPDAHGHSCTTNAHANGNTNSRR